MTTARIKATAGILTYNSEAFLERCLKSLEGFDEILVADGGSTDATLQIAKQYGCRVIAQSKPGLPITDFALERNRLVEAATYDWFLSIDSDELLSPELKDEIREVVERGEAGPLVYKVPYRIVNEDLSVIYRSFKTYYQHRFFNRTSGARFVRKVHERVVFDESNVSVGTFSHPWYVPLDIQLDFNVYRGKVDHRIRIMVEERPPRGFLQYLSRLTIEPVRNISKQFIKFVWLRLKHPATELTPARYELYKLYSQWVVIKEATRQYARQLRVGIKETGFLFAYSIRSILRKRPEVAVLMYHAIDDSGRKLSVRPRSFAQQMAFLATRKNVVSLDDVVEYAKGEKVLLDGSVAITFDDGYRDLQEVVQPILERYKLPATVFITTDIGAYTDPDGTPRLSWEEIKELSQGSVFSFEAHGRTHKAIAGLSRDELRTEVEDPRKDLERELGRVPSYFAYPYGARSQVAEEGVQRAGYSAAFSITEGLVYPGAPLFRLKRIQVDGTVSFRLFKIRLTRAVDINRAMVDWFRRFF